MKKMVVFVLLLFAGTQVLAELPIVQTRFRKAPVETVKKYAEQDDAEAQLELALRFYAGHQVSQNFQESFNWSKRSAYLGNPDAQSRLIQMYQEGIGTERSEAKAEEYLIAALVANPANPELKAEYTARLEKKGASARSQFEFFKRCADAGYAPAYIEEQYPVATNLYEQRLYEEALTVFKELAEKGDSASIYYLGKMYSKGQGGLPEDHIEAFDRYQHAASNDYAEAQYELAVMYAEGRGTLEDRVEAAKWYEKAARNGCAEAQYSFAEIEFSDAQEEELKLSFEGLSEEDRSEYRGLYLQKIGNASKWYEAAAEQGHVDAQYMLGRLYAAGRGVRPSSVDAVRLYAEAAEQNHPEAQFRLGLMYHAGLGVKQDLSKAMELYKKAADKGVEAAMYYLGNCSYFGEGLPKSSSDAEKWYRKAVHGIRPESSALATTVDSTVLDAARELGIILWSKGVSEDEFKQSKKWIGFAAQNGDQLSQDILIRMNVRDRRSYQKAADGETRPSISMSAVRPEETAGSLAKDLNVLPFYLQVNLEELYQKTDVNRNLSYVRINDNQAVSVTGEDLWKIEVYYKRSLDYEGADFDGMMLVSVEFTDRDTQKRYYAVAKTTLGKINSSDDPSKWLKGFVDMSKHPKAKLTGYSVVYAHQVRGSDFILAVLDEETKSREAENFSELYLRNQHSEKIEIYGFRELL